MGVAGYQKAYRFTHILEWVAQNHGDAGLKSLREKASPELRKLMYDPLLPSARLLYGTNQKLLQLILDTFYGGDVRRAAEITRVVTRRDISTVMKFVLTWTTPRMVFKMAQSIWKIYTDTGALVVTEIDPHHAECFITGLPANTQIEAYDFAGSAMAYLDSCRAKNVALEDLSVDNKGIRMRFRYDL